MVDELRDFNVLPLDGIKKAPMVVGA